MRTAEESRVSQHQLNQLIDSIKHQVESSLNENKLLKETVTSLEKSIETYKFKIEDLLSENEQLTKFSYSKIESGNVNIVHSSAYDLNDFVKVRGEHPLSWTKIFKNFGKAR